MRALSIDTTELDASLQSELPLIEVGIYTPFEPLNEPGARLLLTATGLMLESCNGVFHAITPLGTYTATVRLPYGKVTTGVTTLDKEAATQLYAYAREFLAVAAKHAPLETIMLVVKGPGRPMRCIHPALNQTNASLDYQDWVHMEEGEHVILDIHSHGAYEAFFSSTDNDDDGRFRGHLKTSCVIGHADQSSPLQVQRWVSRGHIFSETMPAAVGI